MLCLPNMGTVVNRLLLEIVRFVQGLVNQLIISLKQATPPLRYFCRSHLCLKKWQILNSASICGISFYILVLLVSGACWCFLLFFFCLVFFLLVMQSCAIDTAKILCELLTIDVLLLYAKSIWTAASFLATSIIGCIQLSIQLCSFLFFVLVYYLFSIK